MIQKQHAILDTSTSQSSQSSADPIQHWGSWMNHKYYTLTVAQQPLRARMCGFGDKDRRPLAPAAVAKMIVQKEDSSLIEPDDLDCSFFLVTVDLWSADGKREMNLVLHPSSSNERYMPASAGKPRKRSSNASDTSRGHPSPSSPSSASASSHQQTSSVEQQTSVRSASYPQPPYGSPTYTYAQQGQPVPEQMTIAPSHPYTAPVSSSPAWSASRSTAAGTPTAEGWQPGPAGTYRTWPGASTQYQGGVGGQEGAAFGGSEMDPRHHPGTASSQPDTREPAPAAWSHAHAHTHQQQPTQEQAHPQSRYPDQYASPPAMSYDSPAEYGPPSAYAQSSYYQGNYPPQSPTPPPANIPPSARHTYTRTLVGPLSANACRLVDDQHKPGIFFLFQDLSVRTEGSFRLRLRLMNVGAMARSPAPEAGALRVHTDISPVLAQTFTEPFTVYSAKRFPGVPDTTPLSIAFGNQGQKLPLRNRHGSSKQGRKGKREGSEDSSGSSGQ